MVVEPIEVKEESETEVGESVIFNTICCVFPLVIYIKSDKRVLNLIGYACTLSL